MIKDKHIRESNFQCGIGTDSRGYRQPSVYIKDTYIDKYDPGWSS